MKVKELIVALLNEDMDDEVTIISVGPRWVTVDGVSLDTGGTPGVVRLLPSEQLAIE